MGRILQAHQGEFEFTGSATNEIVIPEFITPGSQFLWAGRADVAGGTLAFAVLSLQPTLDNGESFSGTDDDLGNYTTGQDFANAITTANGAKLRVVYNAVATTGTPVLTIKYNLLFI